MAEIVTIAEDALVERQKLPAAFGSNAVRPSYDGLGLANIAALATHWLSPDAPSLSEQAALPPFNPDLLAVDAVTNAWKTWQEQAPINHVVLLLMDALGYDQLRTLMAEGDAPGLAAACVSSQSVFMPATSVFPSTTVTGLTSAATAYAPAQHGIVGTNVYLRELGSVVNLIGFRPTIAPTPTPYSEMQLNPDRLLPVPNIYRRLEEAGINTAIVNFCHFRETSVSRFTSACSQAGQSGYIDYLTPVDGFTRLRQRLQANSTGKSFTYMYVPNLDTAAHRYGPLSSCYRAEAAALDFALKRELLEPLAGRTDIVLLLVADHGQCPAYPPDKILWLNQHPTLKQLFFMPATGESQCRFLHLVPGAEAAAIDYVRQHLAEHFLAVSKAEAIALGLFGLPSQPPSAEYCDRIGDLILIPRTDWSCFHHEHHTTIAGVHGGLSRAEMLIPFLAYRF